VRLYDAGRQRLASSDRRPICRLPPWDMNNMISRVAEALYTAILVVIAERKLVVFGRVIHALGELVVAWHFDHLDCTSVFVLI
jgi:hypothetical protein